MSDYHLLLPTLAIYLQCFLLEKSIVVTRDNQQTARDICMYVVMYIHIEYTQPGYFTYLSELSSKSRKGLKLLIANKTKSSRDKHNRPRA